MSVNDGKESESIFLKVLASQNAFVYRFEDLYDAKRKGKVANRKPCDFLVTHKGKTIYAEVKSTIKNSFSFSNIQPEQWRTAVKSTASGGLYRFFVHFTSVNRWFSIPASIIIDSKKKSISIKDLEAIKANDPLEDYEITTYFL